MSEPRIGRVLVASLHQAIGDTLPNRLEFYENWLNVSGLREGTIGLAPLSAVLGFLRTEGEAYDLITSRAGEYAADWTFHNLSPLGRRLVRALPTPLRVRAALRTSRALVRSTYPGSRAIIRLKRGTASIELRGSLFCEVRETSVLPLCGFYASAIARLLHLFALRADARVNECRAGGRRKGCLLSVNVKRAGVGVLSLCLIVLTLTACAQEAAAQPSGSRVLVVPFENSRHEPRLHWLSEGSAVLIADELKTGGLGAITRDERARAFEELHLPLSASLSRATVIKVGQIVGASEIVVGGFTLDGSVLTVTAHSIRVDAGRLQPEVTEQAPITELFGLFDKLARRLVPDARFDLSAREPRPPLDAFENCIKGLIAENPATQATFLETAISKFPGYDRAEIALWGVRKDQGNYTAALAAAQGVGPRSPLASRARFLAGVSLLDLKRNDEAFDLFKSLSESPSGGSALSAAAFNNLGVAQIRRGATPHTGSAEFYLTKAAEADASDADSLFNLGYAYMLARNTQAAVYWLREALRRNPADAHAHYVLAAALHASGNAHEAAREKELARRLSSRYEELERRGTADSPSALKDLERVRVEPDTPSALRLELTIVNAAQREQRELAAFHLDRGRRLYEREEDREAIAELRRAVYLSPYEAQAHLLIGRIHLRAERPLEAVDALKISIWSEDSAPARVALAEAYVKLHNTAGARAELDRALVLDPASADAKRILAGMK